MKTSYRNRSKYVVYFEPWEPGRNKVVTSKWQAKKLLDKAETGSHFFKLRLIWAKDRSSFSFWNEDDSYDWWYKA